MPTHREFIRCRTPSEPILAEAAAQLLNATPLEELAPQVLCHAFSCGLLAQGEQGRVVGRLLWMLAHDKVLRGSLDSPVRFHKPISVINFLKSLFHEKYWDIILNAKPAGDQEGLPLFEAFESAYIHFSHFVDVAEHNVTELNQVYRLLLRGAALNWRQNQCSVDFLTPVLFGSPDATEIHRSATSVLQAQIKYRNCTEGTLLSPSLVNSINEHPVLSLVHELRSPRNTVESIQSPKHLSPSGGNLHARHYQIVAHGCSPETYGVIPKSSCGQYTMLLDSNPLMEDFPRHDMKECVDLLRQMDPCFGLEGGNNECQWFGEDLE